MSYVTIDGQRVHESLVGPFNALNGDFHARTGQRLLVSSGFRSTAEQEAIFRARYVTAGNINGRKVYDTRWWNGQLWYRISSAGTVAQPGTSLHEKNSALDVRDTGGDPGVTRAGTYRSNVLKEIAPNHGFDTTGLRLYGEPWHIDYVGPRGESAGAFSQVTKDRQAWLNANRGEKLLEDGRKGPNTTAAYKRYQEFLGVEPDGDWGPITEAAHRARLTASAPKQQRPSPWSVVSTWNWNGIAAMLRRYDGYVGNNQPGPNMVGKLQRFLNRRGYAKKVFGRNIRQDGDFGDETAKATQRWLADVYGYRGPIDAWFGDGTRASWNAAEAANWAASPQWRQ